MKCVLFCVLRRIRSMLDLYMCVCVFVVLTSCRSSCMHWYGCVCVCMCVYQLPVPRFRSVYAWKVVFSATRDIPKETNILKPNLHFLSCFVAVCCAMCWLFSISRFFFVYKEAANLKFTLHFSLLFLFSFLLMLAISHFHTLLFMSQEWT